MKYNGKKLRRVGGGLECRVYGFGKGRVLKVYGTIGERDRAYSRQRKAFKAGIGPPVYEKIDLGKGNRAYVSHRVRVAFFCDSDSGEDNLGKAMTAIGLKDFDLNNWNRGIYQGRPVVIDFGDVSVT